MMSLDLVQSVAAAKALEMCCGGAPCCAVAPGGLPREVRLAYL